MLTLTHSGSAYLGPIYGGGQIKKYLIIIDTWTICVPTNFFEL